MSNTETKTPAMPTDGIVESEATEIKSPWSLPEWKVSGIFSSHMVLQRDVPIKVWGWSSHIGAKVCAVWEKETSTAEVDENGHFELTFSPHPANFTPTEMTVFSDFGKDTFEDILVGDVWVMGGQSNAEHHLEPCLTDTPEIAETINEEHPIRLFKQSQSGAMAAKEYHNFPSPDIIRSDWRWKKPDDAAAKEFSAIGYYFARLVQPKINVPVGMVMMCAGGACLRELMPQDLANRLGYEKGANVPVAGYYNTLINPLIGLQFKGQIYFQGESEGIWIEMAHSYAEDLLEFVEDERKRFGHNFSFYNIQLCSYREEGGRFFKHLYIVRNSQLKALSIIPNSYLTVSRDCGSLPEDEDFAHSPHKIEIARRVANQALAGDYGIGDISSAYSPLPVKAELTDGTVTVEFKYTNGNLRTADGEAVKGFSFTDSDGNEIPADAEITGENKIKVTVPNGANKEFVQFAMNNIADTAHANLCGGTGLPVPAFKIKTDK